MAERLAPATLSEYAHDAERSVAFIYWTNCMRLFSSWKSKTGSADAETPSSRPSNDPQARTTEHTSASVNRLPPEHPEGIRNLQVGCGPQHIRDAWWNTDLRAFKGIDEQLDATAPWRWTNVLNLVYAEHFLEHLDPEGAMRFIENSGRALARGGHLRLSTPALEWVWISHMRLNEPDDDDAEQKLIYDTMRSNRAFHGWGHKFLWSKALLRRVLEGAGFENVRFCEYGQSDIPELAGMELHRLGASVGGYPSVWIVEATRGDAGIKIDADIAGHFEEEFLRHVRGGH